MRLDKYISSSTDYSRSEVKRLIKQGTITINACTISNPAIQVDILQDQVSLNGEIIHCPSPRYFMLNKPTGTVCATTDSEHPTVIDLLDEPNLQQLQIVGRLDKDTTGLLLITDDGQWNHRITSPNNQCFKEYKVTTATSITTDMLEQLECGVLLNNEKQPTLPAQVRLIEDKILNLSIQEGKYHQVKRMLAAVNNHVVELHRQGIGQLTLDKSLCLGEYRSLTPDEINLFAAKEQ